MQYRLDANVAAHDYMQLKRQTGKARRRGGRGRAVEPRTECELMRDDSPPIKLALRTTSPTCYLAQNRMTSIASAVIQRGAGREE